MNVSTSKVTSKGQIVIPKDIRRRYGWRPGTRLEIREQGDQIVLRVVSRPEETSLEDLKGCAHYEGPTKSLEDMEDAIAEAALEMASR